MLLLKLPASLAKLRFEQEVHRTHVFNEKTPAVPQNSAGTNDFCSSWNSM